jgi:succinoglycan biosynthesis protein ExoM
MPVVTICAITYRRPEGLVRLLEGIERQCLEQPQPSVEVIVVDNDANGSARSICQKRSTDFRWPLHYSVEPEPGISQARNHALRLALPRADLVAFIDDDEVPEPNWLAELLGAARRCGADVVTGPVVPYFPEPVPEWVLRGEFFERPRHSDGAEIPVARTGNVLVHRRVFDHLGTWFDPKLGLSGSSDTLFFMRAKRAGFRIVWADRAEVVEWVPTSRATTGWLCRRNFRGGNGYARCTLLLDRSPKARIVRAAKGVGQIAQGLLPLPVGAIRGRHVWMRHWLRAAFGLGTVAGVLGYFFQEYRRAKAGS